MIFFLAETRLLHKVKNNNVIATVFSLFLFSSCRKKTLCTNKKPKTTNCVFLFRQRPRDTSGARYLLVN